MCYSFFVYYLKISVYQNIKYKRLQTQTFYAILHKRGKNMNRILPYLKNQKLRLALELTIKIIGTLMDLAIPYVLTHIIDKVIPVTNQDNFENIIINTN
jgi:ABC-type bacteriocin/lantibiotic exporter with double-glycine peptidase domain